MIFTALVVYHVTIYFYDKEKSFLAKSGIFFGICVAVLFSIAVICFVKGANGLEFIDGSQRGLEQAIFTVNLHKDYLSRINRSNPCNLEIEREIDKILEELQLEKKEINKRDRL